jgi:signal peptidase II
MNEARTADTAQEKTASENQVGATAKPPRAWEWRIRLSWLLVIAVIFALDRITKWMVVTNVNPLERVPVIDGLLYITYIENLGAAFGIFADLPSGWRELFLLSLHAVALTLVIFYSLRMRAKDWLPQLALHLIFAGAMGNLADRLIHGAVTDFILFRHGEWSFPAFNVADSAIVVGVGLLLLDTFFPGRRRAEAVSRDPASDALNAGVEMDLVGARKPGPAEARDHSGGNDREDNASD